MSDLINKKPPSIGADPALPAARPEAAPAKPAGGKALAAQIADGFVAEGGKAKGGPRLPLQVALAQSLPKMALSNAELQQLAGMFAQITKQHPNANRSLRARLVAKALLRRPALKSVFGAISDADMEELCERIGSALESSPGLAQLVDEVTGVAHEPKG